MNINREFIDELVSSFHGSFMSDTNDWWCDLAEITPINDFYKKPRYQKVYALRYIPAYYFEYCVLADLLYQRIRNDYNFINIASFGCGLSPDYYALRDNLNGILFDYYGYDAVQWSTKSLMRQKDDNFSFKLKNIGSFNNQHINDIDVFIFPKSIADIGCSNQNVINHLAKLIASTPKKRIFFLNSFVGKEISSSDKKMFKPIHDALNKNNFITNDDIKTTYRREKSIQGLKGIDYSFDYPNDKFIYCEHQGSQKYCNNCNVIKRPILTNQFMDYQILEYIKNDY